MKTNSLYNIAEKSAVRVDRFGLPTCRSVSVWTDGRCAVALDPSLSGAEERVCLAHELGHCETMSFYNLYAPLDVRGKHEKRADRWAILHLVPKAAYRRALRQGYTEIYSLAEYFDVTPEFMQKAVEYYTTA